MRRWWRHAALGLVAVAAALFWPLTPAVPPDVVFSARLASAAAAVLVCTALATWNAGRRATIAIASLSGVIALTLLLLHVDAQTRCLVDFEGRPVVIGTAYTPDIRPYIERNPGLSPADRLFDAGGVAERVWTGDSIRSCTRLVTWAGVGAIPFLAASAAILMRRRAYLLPARAPATSPRVAGQPEAPAYDAFLSYRHLEPDRTLAFDLVETLEHEGLRVAIDARDFLPNQPFLSEMERCIRQSRFVLCVITAQYVQSDHTSEEAIISTTLDLAERRRRLVPLIYERVELPVWLHSLAGIDFTPAATVDPRDRLVQLLTTRQA